MAKKPTYEELNESVKELKKEVAKQKRLAKALRASEEEWHSLIDNAPNIIFIVDRKGIIRYVNHTVPGLEVESTLDTSHYDYAPRKYHKLMKESIEQIFKTGQVASYEIAGVGPKGSTSWYIAQLWPVKRNGQVVAVAIMPRDINQQKQAEEALRVSEEQLRTFMDSMTDFCAVTDKSENLIYVNKSMTEKLGYSKEEMIGMHISRIISEESMVKFIDEVNELVEKGELSIEATWLTKDGKKIHGEINTNAIYDSEGNYTGSRGVFRNITERKRAEEALRKAHDELETQVEDRTAELKKANQKLKGEIEERKRAEKALQKREAELESKSILLQEVNTALRILLKQREEDRSDLEEKVLSNVKQLVSPYLQRLKKSGLDTNQRSLSNILESNLDNIVSSFTSKLSLKSVSLTPMEIRTADLVKAGKTNKEIGEILCLSPNTVKFHRYNLRNKLGLKNKKINLRSHLLSLVK